MAEQSKKTFQKIMQESSIQGIYGAMSQFSRPIYRYGLVRWRLRHFYTYEKYNWKTSPWLTNYLQ